MRYILLVAVLVILSSCFARGGIIGEQRMNMDASLANVHAAITSVLRAEKIAIEEDAVDMNTLLVKGRYADQTQVTFHAKKLTEKSSVLTIQVGLFGDNVKSSSLLEKVTTHIGDN